MVAVVCIGRTKRCGHSGRTDVTMQSQAPAHLPRRYRTVMAALSLLTGTVLGILVATGPPAPITVVLGIALGLGAGVAAFVTLEHSVALEHSSE